MVIGITDTLRPSYEHYPKWVQSFAPHIEVVKLSPASANGGELERCDGLLLSGGGDVHPSRYGCEVDALFDGINEQRDAFEYDLIDRALQEKMPILGICRGIQIANVFLGGSMITDAKRAGYDDHGKGNGASDRTHDVHVFENTLLRMLLPAGTGVVNTNHHQAVSKVGDGLTVAARANDGIIEALAWKNDYQASFLLLVQWHPERMEDTWNPLCGGVLAKFLEAVALVPEKDRRR